MTAILVIEDDLPIQDNIKDTLEAEGFAVEGAPNGIIGVQLAKQQLPDLILCDIMMPELDGYGVLQQLREDSQTAIIPFVFLTARTEKDDLRQGMDLGADDYLTKPFTSNQLLTAVKSRLKKHLTIMQKQQISMNVLRKNILYALPHQLRTPLGKIMGHADLLADDPASFSQDEIREMASAILRGGQELHRIFENYLVYAQIEIMASDPEQVQALRSHTISNPGDIIRDQAQNQAQAYARQADLKVGLGNIAVNVSAEDLTKIAAEIIDNGFKFSSPGSPIKVWAGREDSTFAFYVRDYGRGMTTEQIKSIGAYMQFERAIYEQQGLGLGLIIAKRLVELYGGQFSLKSQPNQGTIVGARFPV